MSVAIAGFIRSILRNVGARGLQSDLNRGETAFGPYVVRPERRRLVRDGKEIPLTGKAYDLLLVFLESGGRIMTRDELYERLWGDQIVEDANLSQTVYLLRRALDPQGDGRAFVETVSRIGYRFAEPVRVAAAPLPVRRPGGALATIAACALVLLAGVLGSDVSRHVAVSNAAVAADALGEYHLALRTPEHLSYALTYFQAAERAAPGDALAYAGEASAYALLAEFQIDGTARQRAFVSRALASCAAALRRDPKYARALAVQGFIAYRFREDPRAAARDLERALAIDPSDAEAHLWHGVLLMRGGELTAARNEFLAAHQLTPTSEVYTRWLARADAFDRKPDAAIAEAQETLRIEPDDAPAMLTIAQAQEQRGDISSALATLAMLVREDPYERPFVVPDETRLELRLGAIDPQRAVRRVRALAISGRADPFETALLYFAAGRRAEAVRMLRRADRSTFTIQRHDPRLLAMTGPRGD